MRDAQSTKIFSNLATSGGIEIQNLQVGRHQKEPWIALVVDYFVQAVYSENMHIRVHGSKVLLRYPLPGGIFKKKPHRKAVSKREVLQYVPPFNLCQNSAIPIWLVAKC